jgi:hypothetical protein
MSQYIVGCAIAETICCQLLITDVWVHAQVGPSGIHDEQNGTGACFVQVLWFQLEISFHSGSIFNHVTSGGWGMNA